MSLNCYKFTADILAVYSIWNNGKNDQSHF